MTRRGDLDRFYDALADLRRRIDGPYRLADCHGRMDWPDRGVYFFLAADERRSDGRPRVTRIGTHAVSAGSKTGLWDRIRTHRGATRGTYEGGGNHRGSVFRKRVGEAFIEREGLEGDFPTWGDGSSADREVRLGELELERRVSQYVRDLPFLYVTVDDEPGPESERVYVERNAIALVSNYGSRSVNQRRDDWLGRHSRSSEIREAGIWNVNHVEETYDPAFIELFRERVSETKPASGRR